MPIELLRIRLPHFGLLLDPRPHDLPLQRLHALRAFQQPLLPVQDHPYATHSLSHRSHAARLLPHLDPLLPIRRNHHAIQRLSSYITLARDLYEGVAMLAFFYLMFSFIGYDHEKVRKMLDRIKSMRRRCT